MADPRFFQRQGPFSRQRLAEIAGAEIAGAGDAGAGDAGAGDADAPVRDVAPLDTAGPDDVSFLDNRRYMDAFKASKAGTCVVDRRAAENAPAGMTLLVCDKPYRGYARIAQAFYPHEGAAAAAPEIHGSAVIDERAQIGDGVDIAAGVVIGGDTVIGDGVRLGANTVIGAGVEIGAGSRIGANVTLSHCRIGAETLLHPGVRVGQRGFGFDMAADGHLDVPQLGRVIIGDHVEIGANTTVDRGAGPDTVIGDGCKIDNLVQIGHNVKLGRGCVIVAQVGLSGSSELADLVVVGGQAGVAGHIKLAAGTQVAAQSGVLHDTNPGERVAGSPAQPARRYFKLLALMNRLVEQRGLGEK